MKLIEALEIIRRPAPMETEPLAVALVCGFVPLHLETLLAAHLRLLLPTRAVRVETGLYGDIPGTLDSLERLNCHAGIVLVEWTDLDPRLGLRSLGSWAPSSFEDILTNIRARCRQIEASVQRLTKDLPLVFCGPTLPFPPIAFTSTRESSSFELQVHAELASLSAAVAQNRNIRIVSLQRLDQLSASTERFDVDSELRSGFPYKLTHAAVLSETLANLLQNPAPKKGIITDLDDTLWRGLLGEVGIEGISWDLDHQSQMHGAYQRLLHAMSECGVLVGIASKNDPSLAQAAFRRKDLVFPERAAFPIEVHWGPKSESVARILKLWNIGADSVVFIDDSPMELAEVKSKHPELQCLRFPTGNSPAILDLMLQLRDLFGKNTILEEDKLRMESVRRGLVPGAGRDGSAPGVSTDDFLQHAEAELTLNYQKQPLDPRALELINKTNQFNLNGKRHTEATLREYLKRPDVFSLVVSYKDKFGPLGKIAVIIGRHQERDLFVDSWVMSCRAFSRRIEHRCLEELFSRFGAEQIVLDLVATPRNEPFRRFLEEVSPPGASPASRLTKAQFLERRPKIFHRVQETGNG